LAAAAAGAAAGAAAVGTSSDFRFMKMDRFISSFFPASSSDATLSDSLSMLKRVIS
jgi:hypothetical protein